MADERTARAREKRKRARRYLRRRLVGMGAVRDLIRAALEDGGGDRRRMRAALNWLARRTRSTAERLWKVDYPSRHPRTSRKWRRRIDGRIERARVPGPGMPRHA